MMELLTETQNTIRDLTKKAEKIHPMNLAKQFKIVREYATPCFEYFCEIKKLSKEHSEKLEKIIIDNDRNNKW